ncbi:putative flavin-containing monooxygenase [Gordonia effusa NBRC 100432]|uniref:Putative flavin-containing monooxygenase n=1 Tax=Gordonia effusa NBRC 100432 TaxID=1077974 RepID=H0R4Y6_9ACTN|nr:NAD(P)/FAD-dependent oxidoreductase [Gordonia effusa]GAB20137.1 putative flavin-containing monooxygenase [Gordonia effusa NBRC 100432]
MTTTVNDKKRPTPKDAPGGDPQGPAAPDYQVAIIGAGPGGIATGVKLSKAGINDYVIIERSDNFGGSWQLNQYPGIAVDIPGVAYQFGFARKHDWSRLFPFGPEVKQYHQDVAREYGLYEHAMFNTDVEREIWDDAGHYWKLHTSSGKVVTARFVISAVGAFVRPKAENIPGVSKFKGKIQRPTSWDYSWDLTGKKVAVIGTGASAVQIIPAIAKDVGSLSVFQRTPVWCAPIKPDGPMPKAAQGVLKIPGLVGAGESVALVVIDLALRAAVSVPLAIVKPVLTAFDKVAIKGYAAFLKLFIRDAETAKKLTPNYGVIAKRPTMSNGYLQAFNRSNVSLITDPIETVTAKGIKTRDGVEHDFDMIVLATGYDVFSDPETYLTGSIVGREGFDLGEFYTKEGMQAYQSASVHGIPNRWMLVGPYSWTGSGWHAFVEMTADHAIRAITEAKRRDATLVEVHRAAADAYHKKILHNNRAINFYLADLNAHVPTYYRNSHGHSTYIRPSGFFEASRGNRKFPYSDYSWEKVPAKAAAPKDSGKAAGAAPALSQVSAK